jgi:hypothetical protein
LFYSLSVLFSPVTPIVIFCVSLSSFAIAMADTIHDTTLMLILLIRIIAAIVLTILPGSWIMYGLRLSGIPSLARLAMAIALSPAMVGLQLVILESLGVSFKESAKALLFLNLPCTLLLIRPLSTMAKGMTGSLRSWLPSIAFLALIVAVPVLIWSLIPGLRTYEWETMLHTDVVYAIARDGAYAEEPSLAGLTLAYGWMGHSYWSVIGWLGDWAPTRIYPLTNILWIFVTFILSYQVGVSGLGLRRTTALLGVVIMFLGTNVVGMIILIIGGYSQWWERYFGDIRYTPFLSKFYAFDTMLWGMALLIAIGLIYTIGLRQRVSPVDGLTFALLVGLGLVYPVLFPAGLLLAGCFVFLLVARLPNDRSNYTLWELARLGLAILSSVILVWLYVGVTTADRDAAIFTLSQRWAIRLKALRFVGAMSPFMVMAAVGSMALIRRRREPTLLLLLSAMGLSGAYVVIDLMLLEYKYVLAATFCLTFLAAAAMDSLFQGRPRLGSLTGLLVSGILVVINLLLVFEAGGHIPDNLDRGAPLDEHSFWIALSSSAPDSAWTTAIRERTSQDTVVIARKPGVNLSAIVARSMYVPSDTEGGLVPGYNLDQRFYLLQQRGYPAKVYDHRLGVVEILYTSENQSKIIEALHSLKELERPVAIYFSRRDTYLLRWLEAHAFGANLISESQNTVWLIQDLSTIP